MKIFNIARKAAEYLYEGICSVYVLESARNEETKQTEQTEVLLYENQPCRLSYNSNPHNSKYADTVHSTEQIIELFISPEINMPTGAKIVITQNGCTETYKSAGIKAMYTSHQEIELELFERWA